MENESLLIGDGHPREHGQPLPARAVEGGGLGAARAAGAAVTLAVRQRILRRKALQVECHEGFVALFLAGVISVSTDAPRLRREGRVADISAVVPTEGKHVAGRVVEDRG